MKLRITRTDVCFRISKEEYEELLLSKTLNETLFFSPENIFTYQINISEDLEKMELDYNELDFTLTIPSNQIFELGMNNSLRITRTTSEGHKMNFIVEIDLPKSNCC